MSKTTFTIVGGILLFGVLVFVAGRNRGTPNNVSQNANQVSNKRTQNKKTDPLPKFSFKDFEGNEVSSESLSGKPMIVNSWAVWCPFCGDELVDFAKLQKELGEEVVVIAIDRAESLEKQKEFTDELGVTNEMLFLLDPSDSFYQSIGGFAMPETLFVDRDGIIQLHKRGPMDIEEMRRNTQLIL